MGILRTREEYLPVTCAVLKEADRSAFFNSIKNQKGGKQDQLARLCEVPNDLVGDWIEGKANIPYHTLQMLAHHFAVALPPIGELRREYQQVSQVQPKRRELPPPPPPSESRRDSDRDGQGRGEGRRRRGEGRSQERRETRQPRQERGRQEPKQGRQQGRQSKPQGERQQQPRQQQPKGKRPQAQQAKGPRAPELSEGLAHWIGVVLCAARVEEGAIVLVADRRIGQNFAGSWANETKDLFGAKPALAMKDDGKVQEASLPTEGLADFFARLDLKAGQKPSETATVPRWVWSNPAWKSACLKGIVDVCGHFQRAPALRIEGLSEKLARAAQKILAALGFAVEADAGGALVLQGAELVTKYFESVGTSNMKLKDQYNAYKRVPRRGNPARTDATEATPEQNPDSRSDALPADAPPAEDAGPAPVADEEPLDEIALGEDAADLNVDAEPEPGEEADSRRKTPAPATPQAPAAKPASRPGRRRRTLYRGRPGP